MHCSTYPPQYGQHGDMVMQFVHICQSSASAQHLQVSGQKSRIQFLIKILKIGPPLILSLVQIVVSKTCLSVSVSSLIYVGF